MTDTAPPALRRPRPRFRSVEVISVNRLGPRFISATLGGEALEGFRIEAPTQHIKVLFPAPGDREVVVPEPGPDGLVWPDGKPRPVMRTYTPRRFDDEAQTLDIEFVLHGEGPASAWAERAVPGDRLAVAGPGGRLSLALDDGPWLIAADESSMPAVGTLLDVLPATAVAHVVVEVESLADELPLGGPAGVTVTWVPRDGRGPGDRLAEAVAVAVANESISAATRVWVACEAAAVRRIRKALLATTAVSTDRLVTRGYWRLGEQNHPDHDYGDD